MTTPEEVEEAAKVAESACRFGCCEDGEPEPKAAAILSKLPPFLKDAMALCALVESDEQGVRYVTDAEIQAASWKLRESYLALMAPPEVKEP